MNTIEDLKKQITELEIELSYRGHQLNMYRQREDSLKSFIKDLFNLKDDVHCCEYCG